MGYRSAQGEQNHMTRAEGNNHVTSLIVQEKGGEGRERGREGERGGRGRGRGRRERGGERDLTVMRALMTLLRSVG